MKDYQAEVVKCQQLYQSAVKTREKFIERAKRAGELRGNLPEKIALDVEQIKVDMRPMIESSKFRLKEARDLADLAEKAEKAEKEREEQASRKAMEDRLKRAWMAQGLAESDFERALPTLIEQEQARLVGQALTGEKSSRHFRARL